MYQNQMRPVEERGLPLWQIEALDRSRAEWRRNVAENPAIWQKLSEIEAKLDRVLAALSNEPPKPDIAEGVPAIDHPH